MKQEKWGRGKKQTARISRNNGEVGAKMLEWRSCSGANGEDNYFDGSILGRNQTGGGRGGEGEEFRASADKLTGNEDDC